MKEIFGLDSIDTLDEILEDQKASNIFLVRGNTSYKLSGAEEKLKDILNKYNCIPFTKFSPNPNSEDVQNGINLAKKNNCELVLAVGGGSAIDVAKLVSLFLTTDYSLEDYLQNKEDLERKTKLITIPTTAGSGSEATHFAVVYHNNKKYSIADKTLIPDMVLLDPKLTFSSSKELTASTGMDALSQAIESYWSVNSTKESKLYAKEAIKLVVSNIRDAVQKPTTYSRIAMLRAANFAGKAINISKTSAPHAISYFLTKKFGIPHGHAVGLTLGEFLLYNYNVNDSTSNDQRGAQYIKETITEITNILNVNNPTEARDKIYSIMESIGLKTQLSSLGIKPEDFDDIASGINSERLTNNPRKLDKKSIIQILENRT